MIRTTEKLHCLFLMTMLLIGVCLMLAGCPGKAPERDNLQQATPGQTGVENKPTISLSKADELPLPDYSPPEKGGFTYNLQSEPISLNPVLITDISSYLVTYLIFEALIDVDQHLNYVPRLAKSWEISADSKKITFNLRQDVLWHDGKKVTARDVIFAFEKATDPTIAGFRFKGAFDEVETVKTPDELTVEVYYKQPLSSALQHWASLPIIPKHLYSKHDFMTSPLNQKPVGSGPYKFVQWKKGKTIQLAANSDYWYGTPSINTITFRAIASTTIAFKSLLKGNIDGVEVTPNLWAKYSNMTDVTSQFKAYKFPTLNFYTVGWNGDGTNPFFTDQKVRQALTMAVDRRSIIQKLLLGLAESCTGPFSPHSWGYDHSLDAYPYDMKRAGELLDQAEWVDSDRDGVRDKDGMSFRFSMNIQNNNRLAEQVALMMQNRFEMLGIVMDIQRLENAAYIDRLTKKEYHSCLMALSLGVDPDIYQFLHSSQIEGGFNLTSYSNPVVDKLLEDGRKTFDRTKRTRFYHQIHRQIHSDQPYTFLFSRPQLYFFHKRVKNIKTSPQPLYLYFPGILEWYLAEE